VTEIRENNGKQVNTALPSAELIKRWGLQLSYFSIISRRFADVYLETLKKAPPGKITRLGTSMSLYCHNMKEPYLIVWWIDAGLSIRNDEPRRTVE